MLVTAKRRQERKRNGNDEWDDEFLDFDLVFVS